MNNHTPIEDAPLSEIFAQLPYSSFIIPTLVAVGVLWTLKGKKGCLPLIFKIVALFYITCYLVGVYFYIKKHFM